MEPCYCNYRPFFNNGWIFLRPEFGITFANDEPFFYLFVFLSGFSDDSKNGTRVETHSTSTSSTGSMVVIIFFVLVTVALFSFFLFKLWQRKKREEQYARLLKLFEEDDELELELGLRD